MDGRLSIIIPCGRPETALETVNSILAQDTLPDDLEIVLAGVSIDSLLARCGDRGVAARLPGRRNPAATRMAGVAVATGRHFLFVDDDIVLAPDFIRRLIALLAREEGLGAVGARLPGKARHSHISRVVDLANFWSQQSPHDGERDWLYSATLYMPADVYHAVGGFNPVLAIGEDVDLTQRVRAAGHREFYAADLEARHNHRRTTLLTALRYFWTNGGLARHLFPPGATLERLAPSVVWSRCAQNYRNARDANRDMPDLRRHLPLVAVMYLVFNVSLELERHRLALVWQTENETPPATRSRLGARLAAKAHALARANHPRLGLAVYLIAGQLDAIMGRWARMRARSAER